MGLLDEGELDGISIQRMIFHVVGPEDDDLQLMDEVDASGFENFFLARIRETNVGNRFTFIGEDDRRGSLEFANSLSRGTSRDSKVCHLTQGGAVNNLGTHQLKS